MLSYVFHVVWITISKTIDVDKIQQCFMKEMHLVFDPNEEPYNRAQVISKNLEAENRKVAMLMDDIWEIHDLEEHFGPIEFDSSILK